MAEKTSWTDILKQAVFLNFYGAQKSIPRNRCLCSVTGRYENPIPIWFLAPVDCSKIPAQLTEQYLVLVNFFTRSKQKLLYLFFFQKKRSKNSKTICAFTESPDIIQEAFTKNIHLVTHSLYPCVPFYRLLGKLLSKMKKGKQLILADRQNYCNVGVRLRFVSVGMTAITHSWVRITGGFFGDAHWQWGLEK
jgi:hypothetical protein